MRISTANATTQLVDTMITQQAALARTQNQIASGQRIMTPADDPAGAVQALALERALANSTQYSQNSNMAQNRLSSGETALADAGDLLSHIRDLTVQANSGALDASSRAAIATEVQSSIQQFVDIANRKDGNGEYLFAGTATATQPFARTSGGTVVYSGNSANRVLQVSDTQTVADANAGDATFMNIAQGNGTFVTASSAANTGTGQIDAGTIVNPAAWVPDTYQIQFTSATTYNVVNSAATVVASGNYQPSGAVQWNGASVTIQGQPAAGDVFTATPSAKESIFTTLDHVLATIQRPLATSADKARYSSDLGGSLQQIDQGLTQLQSVRASVGTRLSNLDNLANSRGAVDVQTQATLSQVKDLDYASAITQMNLQYTGLQAAQAAYTRFAQLTLFNYLP
jgi:flagellar hook-associated protein 3 FlgL